MSSIIVGFESKGKPLFYEPQSLQQFVVSFPAICKLSNSRIWTQDCNWNTTLYILNHWIWCEGVFSLCLLDMREIYELPLFVQNKWVQHISLKVSLILKTLISCFSCFSSGLELKSGQWLTRSRIRWALSSCCFHVLMQIHLLSTRGSTLTHWSGLMPVIHPFILQTASPVGSYEGMLESVPEQGRAETFGGAGAQSIKGAHGTRLLIGLCCLPICVSKWMLLYWYSSKCHDAGFFFCTS